MKKTFAVLAAVVMLMAVLVPGASAASGPVIQLDNYAWGQVQTVSLDEGQQATFAYGWTACNKGLLQAFVNAAYIEVRVDGNLVLDPHQARRYWSATYADPWMSSVCISNLQGYSSDWLYYMQDLEEGSHTVRTILTVSHPVPTGAEYWYSDYFSPGRPYMYTTGNFYTVNEFEFIVE